MLRSELYALRLAAARHASGATVHRIDACISNVQTALYLIDRDAREGRLALILERMAVAQQALQEGRALVYEAARSKRPDWGQDAAVLERGT